MLNPADPLEIQADVHWTHIRENQEERAALAPESPLPGGNCSGCRAPGASAPFPSGCRGLSCRAGPPGSTQVRASEACLLPGLSSVG